jgi:eukaryotic-like serine/threonine-protein kinase
MPSLTPAEWARITALFDELQPLAAAERRVRLAALPGHERPVADEVASLLAADADDEFLLDVSGSAGSRRDSRQVSLIGQTLGAYRVEREIGRGGMGVVYAGQHGDHSLQKRVAIKTLGIGLERPELAWRFRRERQILAALEHPNIATLYDGGTTVDGTPYLVMEYVDGQRIDSWCNRQQLTVPARLDLFRQVCAAVQFAHTKLVIHRDLKPGNILVTESGTVKLLDFGVAKLVSSDDDPTGDDAEVTRAGRAPLTAAFASPEQLRGEAVSTSSDVYSLGVLLHRLLSGGTPHAVDAHSAAITRDADGNTTPRLPSDAVTDDHAAHCGTSPDGLRRSLRGELDAIVMMALRYEPARRYASVEALGADVLRFLKGLPVQARPDTLAYRVGLLVRRQRALVTGVGVGVVALLIGTAMAVRSARAATAEAERTRKVAAVLTNVVGAGASSSYRSVPTLLTALDSARSSVAVQFADDAQARADVYTLFGASYFSFERPDLSLLMFDSARVLHARVLGATSLEVARDLAASANAVITLGRTDSAVSRLRTAVAMMRQIRPIPEQDLVEAEIELSFDEIVLLSATDSALPRLRSALERARRMPSPRWDMIAMGEAVTIMPLHYTNARAQADSAYMRTARALQRDSGNSNANRTALAFQGQSLLLRGRPAQAAPVIRELLEATELRFGASHYLTAQAQNLLAKVMIDLSRYVEARALVDSAIASNEAAAARDPLYLGEMYLTRATCDTKLRQWEAAGQSLRQAAVQRDKLGAQRSVLDVSILYTTAALHEAQGRIAQARELYTRAANTARATLQPGARNLGLAIARLQAFETRHPAR